MPRRVRLCLTNLRFATLLIISCGISFSQVNTTTIYGTVTDQAGASVPSAKITAKNLLTNFTETATSNSRGDFTFNFLPVGSYSFSAEATGFQEQIRNNVGLSAGQTVHIEFQLNVSNIKESVTVSGTLPLLSADSSEQHAVLDTQDVHELPLVKADWTSLLQLGNGFEKAGGNGGVSINGLAPSGLNLTVDGTNASSNSEDTSLSFYGGFNVINTINTEAIAEVSTTKGIAPASVAGSMSGNINIITKSGTNQFHGSLIEINSLSDYNARNQFLSAKPRSTFNEFGGSLGGPIRRDKLFFFGDYEGVRNSSFSALNGVVPTPEFASQTLAVAPQYSPVFAVFPKPNTAYAPTAQTATFTGAGALTQEDGNAVGRLDYYISPKDILTFRFTRSRPSQNQPRVISIDPRITSGHDEVYNAQFTHSEASWTSATRFGYNKTYVDRLDQGFSVGLQQVQFGGFNSQGAEDFIISGSTYTWEENIAKNIGRHSIEFGGIIQRWNTGRIDDTTNSFNYSSLSDFLANIPSQIQINFPLAPFVLHMYEFGGFVQDDFRVLPNLTLNLGIRYDYFTVPKERDGRIFNRNPGPLGPGYGDFRPPSSMFNADWPNFAPRVGFAWSLGKQRKTVVRGGGGIFYSPHTIRGGPIEEPLTAANVPFRLTLNRTQALASNLSFPFDTAAVQAQIESSGAPLANTTISPNYPNPSSYQWTLGVQREIGYGLVIDTAYVGNRGLHLNMTRNLNIPDRITGIAPNPNLGQFRWYDGSDASVYNAWQTSIRKSYTKGISLAIAYTYANNMSYGDGDLQLQNAPQNNNNLKADWGPTPYDVRHAFNTNFVYELPFARLMGASGRPAKLLLGGWQISGILSASTGQPVNITDSKSSYASSRPDVVPGVSSIFGNYHSTLQYLNPAAFLEVPIVAASGAAIRPGNLSRDALRVPGAWTLDASMAKNLDIRENIRLQLRADLFNSLNHTNLGGLSANISSSNFGRLTSATSRSMQLGAKLVF
jgi:hypothetical protein